MQISVLRRKVLMWSRQILNNTLVFKTQTAVSQLKFNSNKKYIICSQTVSLVVRDIIK